MDTTEGTTASLEDLYLFKGLWELRDIWWGLTLWFYGRTLSGIQLGKLPILVQNMFPLLIFFPNFPGAYLPSEIGKENVTVKLILVFSLSL
ncbi:MAG: hypothetical protein CM1200mP10_24250 [Candidatus Neomarinimicrobiota bacterium]|nr:MAG: hypothetical protein CM1200mP10_24250 [Candidatus Neomarinimicrobiota bacterium]